MKPKVLLIILIFSLALNLAVFGTFIFRKINSPFGRAGRPAFGPAEMPFDGDMGLNEDQQDEIHKLMREFREMNIENRRAIFELEDELFETIRNEDADSTKINSLINEIGQLRINQSKQAISHFGKFNKFLTPEQQEHFHRMIMERPERQGKRFRGWREGRRSGKNSRREHHIDSTKNVQ